MASIDEDVRYSGSRKVERIMRVVVKQWQCTNCNSLYEHKNMANTCCNAAKRIKNKEKKQDA